MARLASKYVCSSSCAEARSAAGRRTEVHENQPVPLQPRLKADVLPVVAAQYHPGK